MAGNSVTVKLKGDDKDLKRELDKSQKAVKDYSGYVKGALAGMAAFLAIDKLRAFGSSMVELYNVQIAAETKLASVIKSTGGAAGYTLDQFKAMASEMQNLTTTGDETTLSAMAVLATFKNIRGDVFKDATMAMLDMGAVLDGDVKGAAIQLGKALNDPIAGISALSRVGVGFTETQKDMIKTLQESGDMMGAQQIILDELGSQFGGAAADQAATFSGQVTQMWNRIGDLQEIMGEVIAGVMSAFGPVVDVAVSAMENLVGVLGFAGDAAVDFSKSWADTMVEGFKWGVNAIADGVSIIEFLFTNWSNLVEREVYKAMLAWQTGVEDLKHMFTVVAPEYIKWFGENFGNILDDMANYEITVFKNMGKNIYEFFTSLMDWVSGKGGSFEFVALTDGFEATTKKLPEIAARMKTDTEIYLEESVAQMDELISTSWDDIVNKNRNFVNDMFTKPEPVEIDMTPNLLPFTNDELEKKVKKAKGHADDAKDATQAGKSSGLEDLAKSIQESAMGDSGVDKNGVQGVQAADEANRKVQVAADPVAAQGDAGKGNETLAVLKEIRDFYPKLLQKLDMGGLV